MRALVACLALALAACGGGSSVTGPSDVPPAPQAPGPVAQAQLPPQLWGAFTASADVPEAAANAGNVVLVVPTYGDDAQLVASALRANGKVAILSAHHVFGNPRATWDQGWARLKEWAAPMAGLVAAVYVVDEPLHNGIAPATVAEALAMVRRDGYRTMVAEWIDEAMRSGRPGADLYGVTCYMWPNVGSWSMDRCEEAYRRHTEWDVVIGQGFDIYEGSPGSRVWNGTVDEQVARWAALGRQRNGTLWWVWRWPGQEGIGDNPALRAAYNHAGGR